MKRVSNLGWIILLIVTIVFVSQCDNQAKAQGFTVISEEYRTGTVVGEEIEDLSEYKKKDVRIVAKEKFIEVVTSEGVDKYLIMKPHVRGGCAMIEVKEVESQEDFAFVFCQHIDDVLLIDKNQNIIGFKVKDIVATPEEFKSSP